MAVTLPRDLDDDMPMAGATALADWREWLVLRGDAVRAVCAAIVAAADERAAGAGSRDKHVAGQTAPKILRRL